MTEDWKPPKVAWVRANRFWTRTGIQLSADTIYDFSAEGHWVDLLYRCGPAGFPSPNALMRQFESRRRVPERPWLALIGAIDEDALSIFHIGASAKLRPPRSGMLTCFANDVPNAYFNNFGRIALTVSVAQRLEARGNAFSTPDGQQLSGPSIRSD